MNGIFQIFENPVYELRTRVHLPSRNSCTVFFGCNDPGNVFTPGTARNDKLYHGYSE